MHESPLAFVDLEMTGLDPKVDRVIEICVVRKVGGHIEETLETLVNPGKDARFQTDVHGITPAQAEEGVLFADIAERVVRLCQGAVIVAHAAWWDVTFLEAELARVESPVRFPFYLDTLKLARRAIRAESHSLEALSKKLGLGAGGAHRAGEDVRVLCGLFDVLVRDLAPQSPRDLWHVRVAERHARPEIVERCVTLAQSKEPAFFTYRPSHKGARSFEGIVLEVRTDLDPPRVLGYCLPGRGRFDLRADRILTISHTAPEPERPPT